MREVTITSGPITIRSVTEADLPHLHRWLNDPRVLEFYEGRDKPFSMEQLREKYLSDPEVSRCIVLENGEPFGYIQFYPLDDEERREYGYDKTIKVFGMDQFIGEPDRWNQGLGPKMIVAVVNYLVKQGAEVITMDPHIDNPRGIRAYEKCGFKKIKVLPKHEEHEGKLEDCYLMEYRPDPK